MDARQHFNIMTSSDDALILPLAVSLTAIGKNLPQDRIDFYLLHSDMCPQSMDLLSAVCAGYGNIFFHEIRVENPEAFDPLVKAGGWQRETYFPLDAHHLLPDTADRVLYLDAGDVLVMGDIAPYYNCDFEDQFLIVTGDKHKTVNDRYVPFTPEDFHNPAFFPDLLDGRFNSGSYVINLQKMREEGIGLSDYYALTEQIRRLRPGREGLLYFGDQGLLSAAFIGRMKYYGYPQIQEMWYCPYNFCLGYYDHFDKKPDYQPAILHFAGVLFKPWKAKYPVWPKRFGITGGVPRELAELKPMQVKYYLLWLEYLFLLDKVLEILGM